MKLSLEGLTERILPSASPVTQPSVAAMTPQMASAMDQLTHVVAIVQNDVSNVWNAIAQEAAYVHQQWDLFLGITPSAPNQSLTAATPQPGSGVGNSSSLMTTDQHTPHQPRNTVTKQAGSGSGSGRDSSTGHSTPSGATLPTTKTTVRMTPMIAGSGSGSGMGSGSGSGTTIPVGLIGSGSGGVPSLLLGNDLPSGYAETHSVTRSETNTVTVDQSGTASGSGSDSGSGSGSGGMSGSFTIDVVGAAQWGDIASGSGSSSSNSGSGSGSGNSTTSVVASGSGSGQYSYHLDISGVYANGVFTITHETYNETGSYNSSQNTNWTYTYGDSSSSTYEWDTTRSGNYTLSWDAAPDANGQLVYTSYSYSSDDSAHWHTLTTSSGGGYSEATYDASSSVDTTGSGTTLNYTGTNEWHDHEYSYSPNPNGPPYEYHYDDDEVDPVSGNIYVGPVYEPTDDWQWEAGAYNATNFTFHGVSSENASVTELATYHVTDYGTTFDVNSFNSSSHTSDSSHVVDDEPGVPDSGTGTKLFHRDEAYSDSNDVTGSGSYIGGSADADYHTVEVAAYAVADSYVSNNEQSSGYDEDGNPYTLVFDFSQDTTGNGSVTATHDYHDGGNGLALTAESFQGSGSSQVNSHDWGTRNGEAFDDSSETPEDWNSSSSLPGDPTPVAIPDGMEDAFPQQDMVNPNGVFFAAQPWPQRLPTTPVGGIPGKVQDWYNRKVMQIGEQAKKKVGDNFTKEFLLQAIQDNNPGGAFPKPNGTYTLDSGYSFAQAAKDADRLDKSQKNMVKTLKGVGWKDPTAGKTVVQMDYVIDQATQNPRSGNLAVTYTYITTFTGTKNGVPVSQSFPLTNGGLLLHDGKLETMKLTTSP